MRCSLETAKSRFDRGDLSGARDELSTLIEKGHKSAEVCFLMGRCWFETLREAPVLNRYVSETVPDAYGLEPRVFVKRETKRALLYFREASKLEPKVADYHFWMARCHEEEGEDGSAYQAYLGARYSVDYRKTFAKDDLELRCNEIFRRHKELQTTLLKPVEEELELNKFNALLNSEQIFDRFRALEIFLQSDNKLLNPEIIRKIKELAGKKILSCYLPFSGDADDRVKRLAKHALSLLNN